MENINDNRPLSTWPIYWPGVPENSPDGTLVGTVDATDPDPDATITYEITAGNTQSFFTIDHKTGTLMSIYFLNHSFMCSYFLRLLFYFLIIIFFAGEIHTTGRKLDREKQEEHVLEVTIHDGGNAITALSSTAVVTVNVLDENDNAPYFLERIYKIKVPHFTSPPSSENESAIIKSKIKDGPIGQVKILSFIRFLEQN